MTTKRTGCLAASTPDQLAAIVKNRLKRIQYRPSSSTSSSPKPDSPSNLSHRREAQMLTLQGLVAPYVSDT